MSIDKIRTKTGFSYRARVCISTGRRITRCFSRKVDAEQWEARLKLDDTNSIELKRKQIRFGEFVVEFMRYKKAEVSPSTYQKYDGAVRLVLNPRFGDYWIEQISKQHVMDFKVWLSEYERSDSIKNFTFILLQTIFKKAIELGYINSNPASSVRPPKRGLPRTEHWNEDEVIQFLIAMNVSPRLPLYLIALNTGMRVGEIFGLKWDCVDLVNRFIYVRRTLDQKTGLVKETTKTHKGRSFGINDSLYEVLVKLKASNSSEHVFSRQEAGCKHSSHIAREFQSDCKKAGVRPIKFHDLRHTYATHFVRNGGTTHALAAILGHREISMTGRYAHFTPDQARKSAQIVSFELPKMGNVVPLESRRKPGHKLVMEK